MPSFQGSEVLSQFVNGIKRPVELIQLPTWTLQAGSLWTVSLTGRHCLTSIYQVGGPVSSEWSILQRDRNSEYIL